LAACEKTAGIDGRILMKLSKTSTVDHHGDVRAIKGNLINFLHTSYDVEKSRVKPQLPPLPFWGDRLATR